jgi:hypothetical protein
MQMAASILIDGLNHIDYSRRPTGKKELADF